jgi:hypothetical protein
MYTREKRAQLERLQLPKNFDDNSYAYGDSAIGKTKEILKNTLPIFSYSHEALELEKDQAHLPLKRRKIDRAVNLTTILDIKLLISRDTNEIWIGLDCLTQPNSKRESSHARDVPYHVTNIEYTDDDLAYK